MTYLVHSEGTYGTMMARFGGIRACFVLYSKGAHQKAAAIAVPPILKQNTRAQTPEQGNKTNESGPQQSFG